THVSLRSGPRTRSPQEHDLHGLAPERPQALNAFGTRVPAGLRPGPFETADPESGDELGCASEGKPRDERDAQFEDGVLPKMEVDLDPAQAPPKGLGVGRTGKVCEQAGKSKRAFSGFEAEPGKTPHQSLFCRG